MTTILVRAVLLSVVATLVTGCAHRAPPPAAAPEPAPAAADLPPPDRIPGQLTLRQKLAAKSAHGGGSFETILQKRPGVLRVVGLTPFGTRAFLLEQRGPTVDFTSYVPRELPFAPTFMLLDIHRVFDSWLDGPPPADGQRSATVGDEQITERWQGGHLQQRTFLRTTGLPPGAIIITYKGEALPGVAAEIVLDNARHGYQLTIQNLPAASDKSAPAPAQ
ncbi:MAG TPA: DUF3261 domain-containing protein [Polyangia bacterium]|nr:DUF3261 domain-containing protein [Polyangia bacterium]